ncbi:MAG: hypothetical protein FWG66_04455 [Spirochaetes bacterium]|nr:hypothetical protein [Spirochaetota bacterium]
MMNNKKSKFWILAAALPLFFASCRDGGPVVTQAHLASLSLSGAVYTHEYGQFAYFTGDIPGFAAMPDIGQTGEVAGGVFSFALPAQPGAVAGAIALEPLYYFFDYFFDDFFAGFYVNISDREARGVSARSFRTEGAERISRGNWSASEYWQTDDFVVFVYADRPFSIYSDGQTIAYGDFPLALNAFRIDLSQGWNAIHESYTFSAENSVTVTLAGGNPAGLRWVLWSAGETLDGQD